MIFLNDFLHLRTWAFLQDWFLVINSHTILTTSHFSPRKLIKYFIFMLCCTVWLETAILVKIYVSRAYFQIYFNQFFQGKDRFYVLKSIFLMILKFLSFHYAVCKQFLLFFKELREQSATGCRSSLFVNLLFISVAAVGYVSRKM